MTRYITSDTELTSVADAIRAKGGTQASLEYPAGFITAIGDISGGGVTCASISSPYVSTYYTDENMQAQTMGSGDEALSPIGSVVVCKGVAQPGFSVSGMTLITNWGSSSNATRVYKVTG